MKARRSFLDTVASWPKVSPYSIADHPGRVVHITVRHDEWCVRFKRGFGCNCNPDVSANLQPREFGVPTQ